MVFSSVPAYLDPSNWQQQQAHQIIGNSSGNHHLLPPPPPPQSAAAAPPPLQPHGGGVGSIRPGSMSERARMANIPMPETALKCPRCESTNTKFCYFNNYSLTQPRHFCKTCRRYWTRGGALRNVPVGGGCRRNKRSTKSSSNSKSSPASGDRQTSATSTSTISTNSGGGAGSLFGHPPQLPPLRFMSPLSQLTENFTSDMGLNYSGGANEMNFHGGSNLLGGASLFTSGGAGIEPWRFQQFPFLNGGNLDPSPPAGINYQFHGGESGFLGSESRPKISNSLLSQLASVKMEESREMNLSRQLAGGGINTATDHQWNNNVNNAAAWTDLSSFSSSSTSNQL